MLTMSIDVKIRMTAEVANSSWFFPIDFDDAWNLEITKQTQSLTWPFKGNGVIYGKTWNNCSPHCLDTLNEKAKKSNSALRDVLKNDRFKFKENGFTHKSSSVQRNSLSLSMKYSQPSLLWLSCGLSGWCWAGFSCLVSLCYIIMFSHYANTLIGTKQWWNYMKVK